MDNIKYEIFMRRGFKCERGKRKGADVGVYADFAHVSFEHLEAPNNVNAQREFNQTIAEVKQYMVNALTHSLKRVRRNVEGTTAIQTLSNRTQAATTKDELDTIIEDGITIFNQYQINLPDL